MTVGNVEARGERERLNFRVVREADFTIVENLYD
jgi:hypothetical protein